MPSIPSDARFLGVDIQAVWREIRQPWLRMHQWPLLSWLTPDAPVVLMQTDGSQSLWLGEALQPPAATLPKTHFTAIELSEDLVLRCRLSMPTMAEVDIAQAAELEARSISPFAAEDLTLAYRARPVERGSIEVEIALASRKQIAKYLADATQQVQQPQTSTPEVWVRANPAAPMVFSGYGEGARQAYAARWRHIGYGLVFATGALLVALAITPAAQLRLRVIEAVYAYDGILQRAAPLVTQREALLQSTEQLTALSEVLAERIEPLRIMETLTQVLPDDTSLQIFKLQGAKITITGTTANTSALMQLLGNQPGLHDVRAPSAAMRPAGASKETFTIEFSLDTQLFGVVSLTPSTPAAPTTEAAQSEASPPAIAEPAAPVRAGGPSFGSSRPRVPPPRAETINKPTP